MMTMAPPLKCHSELGNRFHFPTSPRRAYPSGMEDDPDYRELKNVMGAFVVLPILAYGIVRLIFVLVG